VLDRVWVVLKYDKKDIDRGRIKDGIIEDLRYSEFDKGIGK